MVASALWALVAHFGVTRQLSAAFHADGSTGEWSIWWRRAGSPGFHGRYTDQVSHNGASLALEVEPSGAARDPGGEGFAYELWLYAVDPLAPRAPDLDLKAAIRTLPPDDLKGSWFNFEQGPGVVYSGREAGLMRVPAPGGGLVLAMAKVPRGGPVTLRYAGQEITLDLYSPTIERVEVRLDDPHWASAGRLEIRESLPAYALEDLTLAWHGFATPKLESASVEVQLFGWDVAKRPLSAGGEIRHEREDVASTAPGAPNGDRASEPAEAGEVIGAPEGAVPSATEAPGPSRSSVGTGSVTRREWHMLTLRGAMGLPVATHLLGVLASAAGVVGVVLGVRKLARAVSAQRIARLHGVWSVAGLVLVVMAALGVARGAPLFITSDGVVYIDGAVGLAEGQGLTRFVPYKAPGLTFITALGLWLAGDFEVGVRWINASCTIAAALFAWAAARRAVARWAGPVAALIVGCCPMTLTYQAYLLRECPSIAILSGIVFAFTLRASGVLGQRARPMLSSVLLGVLCGFGALLRENLQLLVVLVPLLVLGLEWRSLALPRRLTHAGVCAAIALAFVVPYIAHMKHAHGYLGVVTPKLQYNRAIAAHQNGVVDFADAVLFDRSLMRAQRDPGDASGSFGGKLTEYDFVLRSLEGALARGVPGETTVPSLPPDLAPHVLVRPTIALEEVRRNERIYKRIVDEAISRNPGTAFAAMARSLGIQLGLIVVYDPVAAANEWYARPLRGEAFSYVTNVQLDLPSMVQYQPGLLLPRTQELIRAAERATSDLSSGAPAGSGTPGLGVGAWFNEAFWVWRLLKPVLGALSILGGVIAVVQGVRGIIRGSTSSTTNDSVAAGARASNARAALPLAATAVILLLQALAASVVVMTPVDRFGAPLLALEVPLAVYALGVMWRATRRGPEASG